MPTLPSAPSCDVCEKSIDLCICSAVKPITNRVHVIILRHPQEQDEKLGTARLTVLQLKNASLKTGLSWANLTKVVGHQVDAKRWGILYLGAAKASAPLPKQTLTVVDKKGNAIDHQEDVLAHLEGIILLDGSWAQAKALWWRNAWMLKCQRLILQPPASSLYKNLRKEPRRESVSTLEATAYTLACLDKDQSLVDRMLPPFHLLLDKIRKEKKEQQEKVVPKETRKKPFLPH